MTFIKALSISKQNSSQLIGEQIDHKRLPRLKELLSFTIALLCIFSLFVNIDSKKKNQLMTHKKLSLPIKIKISFLEVTTTSFN